MTAKLPPYARPIADARRAGLVPARREVAVILDAWRPVVPGERVVVPRGEPVDGYDWSFLRRLGVLVLWSSRLCGRERVMELARCILPVDPVYLIVINTAANTARQIDWIKTLANGVEIKP